MSVYQRIIVSGKIGDDKRKKIEELGQCLENRVFESEADREEYKQLSEEIRKTPGALPSNEVRVCYDEAKKVTNIEIGMVFHGLTWENCYPVLLTENNRKIIREIEDIAIGKSQ